jgi:hypothetical protein
MMTERVRWVAAAAVVLSLLAVACETSTSPTSTAESPATTSATRQIIPILGTTVLRTGTQRVAFILEGATALVREPTVEVKATFTGDGAATPETKSAVFHKWPFGTRGSYVTDLTFDQPGPWRLDITVGAETSDGTAVLALDVAASVAVKEIGTLAPFSDTKTLQTADGDIATITSHPRPDPDLYRVSVAESLFSSKPGVIVFAAPAFCTSPTCGPQVDTVIELKDAYPGMADFIHVEVYDNPVEIQGDLSRGVLSPAVSEWGIDSVPEYMNESWVFVLDANGRITHRFEGYAAFDELEAALLEVL